MRGQLHSSIVLTASLSGKTKLWTIPPDCLQEIRESTKAYREFRQAQRGLLKEIDQRRKQMQSVVAAIEKIRLRQP